MRIKQPWCYFILWLLEGLYTHEIPLVFFSTEARVVWYCEDICIKNVISQFSQKFGDKNRKFTTIIEE